jgi:O-succinylbenzoic acid--CoA ligase
VPSLAVLDAVGTQAFVDALVAAWDRGDAVFPLDPRLPPPAREAAIEAARPDQPVQDGDALVVTTSGTTGPPKAVVLTHEAVRASVSAVSRRLEVDPGRDRWLACLPMAHVAGLGVVMRALLTRTPLELHPRFDPAAVSASSCTLVSLVPTMLDQVDTRGFRAVLVGGGPDWRARPAQVVRTYGMTETCGGVVFDGEPLEGVDVRVDDEGELHVRGPMLLRCYRGAAGLEGSDPKDADGWLATGDRGEVVDGQVVVHGRMSDVIITGGEKVAPLVVERALRLHPTVSDVTVVGRPDDRWGQRVVAMVVPRDPDHPPTLDDLRDWVKEHLPGYCAPREVVVFQALPRTALGKARRA